MEIVGNVKTYDWGKLGDQSIVAQLATLNSQSFKISANTPYSELWMGAHPSGPSTIKKTGEPLRNALSDDLPFLFKVLSIRKALSIQLHPNKAEAERLHRERPDVYKDPNPKPELAIAVTPFLALCGFRPYAEIYRFCMDLPPLKELLNDEAGLELLKNGNAGGLRQCYQKLMSSDSNNTTQCIDSISKNYKQVLSGHNLLDTFQTVNGDFPNDVGVLSLFFMNLLRLQPGEAIYLPANEIHAYLSGDCIECMACSDNVIRAGLTPKYKDVDQLLALLNYTGLPASNKLFHPRCIDEYVQLFAPPVQDFAVLQICLPEEAGSYKMQVKPSSGILLAFCGERVLRLKGHADLLLKRGSIVYISPEAAPEIEFLQNSSTKTEFVAYLATPNIYST